MNQLVEHKIVNPFKLETLKSQYTGDEDLNELIHSFDPFENGITENMIKPYTSIDKNFHQRIIFLAQNPLLPYF